MTIDFNFALCAELHRLLKRKKYTIAVAESCTGGGLSRVLSLPSGSSAIYDRGFTVYTNEAKMELLDVSAATLQTHGAVSAACALEMAKGAITHSHANIAISVTGIAGPTGGSIQKPVGTIHIGIATRTQQAFEKQVLLTGGRKHIRSSTISHALQFILNLLHEQQIT